MITQNETMNIKKICYNCPDRATCTQICEDVNQILPSMEQGRVDPTDLPQLWRGIMFTRAILDYDHILTPKQQTIVRLYYREQLLQKEIARICKVTQQAINDTLERARKKIGQFLKQRNPIPSKH